MDINCDRLLVLVVGAHPQAELMHRPIAAKLAQSMRQWVEAHPDEGDSQALQPLTCTDLWYLNDRALMQQPTIAIGEPGLNAAAASFAMRLPAAMVVDGRMQIQMDCELIEACACIWGVDARETEAAVELFRERYLDSFMHAASMMSA
jgi:hypothetical protein